MSNSKYKVLSVLKKNIGEYVSGESLSETLGVTRAAVWKYIKELKQQGYKIDSSTKKGYMLEHSSDNLNEYELMEGLKTEFIGKRLEYFDVLDSTNNYAKKIAAEGCENGTVVVADNQTEGRGRMGRTWYTACGKGIWMTLVLRPPIQIEEVQLFTLGAAVAVARAIRSLTGFEAGIKWPNDIILEGRKVCGILTEMSSEESNVNFIVIGIGINVSHTLEDFPEDIRDRATSLMLYSDKSGKKGQLILDRADLIKNILFEIEKIYSKINNNSSKEILGDWKTYSVTLGSKVRIIIKGTEYEGTAVDIEQDGSLTVECIDGVRRRVLSGEIQVRGIFGYI
ncbi:MAG: biotin--[acetyl-CoA-carboxylase] ligase [Bacillota bacterium]|nr:biotin--[acetyl-CoA-carboxylase] ligase [Bacillota bacterium]